MKRRKEKANIGDARTLPKTTVTIVTETEMKKEIVK
jgi:hypothetical protein